MDSLEEENLLQMVNDYIESESATPFFSVPSQILPSNNKTKCHILQEIVESKNAAETVVLQSVLKHMRSKIDVEKGSSLKKCLVMCLKMDGYNASLCHTSWSTTTNCPGGDYEYIDIEIKDVHRVPLRLVVDVDFKSQFEVARPTSTYKELSSILPATFVGDEHKLNKIICILCSEAKHSLTESGLHIPPWRTSTYMQSKWFSKYHKVDLSPGGEVGRECKEARFGSSPKVKPKGKGFAGRSSLSAQFSTMSTRCC